MFPKAPEDEGELPLYGSGLLINLLGARFCRDPENGGELLPLLNKFYDEVAKPAVNPHLINLRAVVNTILKGVETLDRRFHFEVHDVGSLASGVSAVVASECDILLCLDIEGNDNESKLSPGFAKFKLNESSAELWPDVRIGRYLHPRKLTNMFQALVTLVVENIDAELKGKYSIKRHGAATTVSVQIDNLKYKADLVLAVKGLGRPPSENACLKPGYEKNWPSQKTISLIKQSGYEMVAKYVPEGTTGVGDKGPDVELLWSLSMSRAETLLLKTIDQGGVSLCHKKLLIIFKALRLNHLVSKTVHVPEDETTMLLTSYHFKSMLFHQAQAYPDPRHWAEGQLAVRFLSFLRNFYGRAEIGDLSPFFFPRIDLCHGRRLINGIGFFTPLAENPVAYIKSVMSIDESTRPLYSIYNSL